MVVDVGVLGCGETGVFAGDQAELDELAVFDDVVEPVGGDPQPVGGQGVQVVAAVMIVARGPDTGMCSGLATACQPPRSTTKPRSRCL